MLTLLYVTPFARFGSSQRDLCCTFALVGAVLTETVKRKYWSCTHNIILLPLPCLDSFQRDLCCTFALVGAVLADETVKQKYWSHVLEPLQVTFKDVMDKIPTPQKAQNGERETEYIIYMFVYMFVGFCHGIQS